ncbi:monocarboxylate transporter 14-like [Ciona intestinalis]
MPEQQTKGMKLDSGWGWVIVVASFVTHTLMAALYFAYGVFTQTWVEDFQSSAAMTALVGSTSSGFASMSAPLASFILNRWGCRTAHMIGGIFVTGGIFTCSFATSLSHIFIFYGVFGGVGLGLCYVPAVIILSQYFKRRRALAVGIASSGIGVGSFIFPLILEYLQTEYTWRGAMLILSAIMAHLCAGAMLLLPFKQTPISTRSSDESKHSDCEKQNWSKKVTAPLLVSESKVFRGDANNNEQKRRSSFQLFRNFVRHPWLRRQSSLTSTAGLNVIQSQAFANRDDIVLEESLEYQNVRGELYEKDELKVNIAGSQALHISSKANANKNFMSQTKDIFSSPMFYFMIINNVTMFMGMMLVFGLTPIRATSDLGFTSEQGALFVSVVGFTNLIGRFSWGVISNIFPRLRPTRLFICLRILAALLTLLSPFAVSFGLQIAFCAAVGLMFGSWSLYPLVVAEMFGDRFLNVAFGYLEVFDGIGSLVGPCLGGLIYDLTSSYQLSFVFAGATLAVGTVVLAIGCKFFQNRQEIAVK